MTKLAASALVRKRHHLWWQIPLFVAICYYANMANAHMKERFADAVSETSTNCSTFNAKGSGYRALFELCERLNLRPRRFIKAYRDLLPLKGTLVIVGPTTGFTQADLNQIESWVRKGNQLVFMDQSIFDTEKNFFDRLNLKSIPGSAVNDETIQPDHKVPEMEHVGQVTITSETRLEGGDPMLSDRVGAFIISKKLGKGRCIVTTAANLCSNRRISDKRNWGNFQFMVNLLQSWSGQIIFDERVHGYSSSQNVFEYLSHGPVGSAVLQCAFLYMLALISLNQRFGQMKTIEVKRKIAASEFITGMSLTYLKARAFSAAFGIIHSTFKSRLLKTLGLNSTEGVELVAQTWSELAKLKHAEVLAFLLNAEALQKQSVITEEQLNSYSNDCDRLVEQSRVHLPLQALRRIGG